VAVPHGEPEPEAVVGGAIAEGGNVGDGLEEDVEVDGV